MRKLLMVLVLLLLPALAFGRDIVLVWDYDIPMTFNVYENGTKIGTTAEKTYTVARDPGVYAYYVTAVDEFWAESVPSNSVSTPSPAVPPSGLKIVITITVTPTQ